MACDGDRPEGLQAIPERDWASLKRMAGAMGATPEMLVCALVCQNLVSLAQVRQGLCGASLAQFVDRFRKLQAKSRAVGKKYEQK